MMQTLLSPKASAQKAGDEKLFNGIWIRWRLLTVGERFVCANIILLPLWWVVGLTYYMPVLLGLGVAFYEWRKRGKLPLKRPSIAVIALFAFSAYQLVRLWSITALPSTLFAVVIWWVFSAFWLWYIQSNKIKLRLEVVAWAFTVSAVQHLGFWVLCQFIIPKSFFIPPHLRTLFALLTRRTGEDYFYLIPYDNSSLGVVSLLRFQFFTRHPLHFAIVAGVMGLIALEIKNRLWSWLLFLAGVFLVFVSGSRAIWLIFPVVTLIYHLLANRNRKSFTSWLCALLAVVSFTTLSILPITQTVFNQTQQSTQAVGELRADSTETRFEVYRLTWKGIQEQPIWGHIKIGEPVNRVYVGLESFVLGFLLYINGLVGTALFGIAWVSLFIWLYQTRKERSLTCFTIFIFYSLAAFPLESVYRSSFSGILLLLCTTLYNPKPKKSMALSHA